VDVDGILVQIERGVTAMSPDDPRYRAALQFFVLDDRTDAVERNNTALQPRVSSLLTDITKERLQDFLIGLLEEMPFSDSLPDIEDSLFDFLLANPAAYSLPDVGAITSRYPTNVEDQCISPTDAVVMNEILLQLLRGLNVQFIETNDLYSYEVQSSGFKRGMGGCRNVNDFF
jgi:hypothetical protein